MGFGVLPGTDEIWICKVGNRALSNGVAKNFRQGVRKIVLFDSGRRFLGLPWPCGFNISITTPVLCQLESLNNLETRHKNYVFSRQGCVHNLRILYVYATGFYHFYEQIKL